MAGFKAQPMQRPRCRRRCSLAIVLILGAAAPALHDAGKQPSGGFWGFDDLSPSQARTKRKAFYDAIDADGNGRVSAAEWLEGVYSTECNNNDCRGWGNMYLHHKLYKTLGAFLSTEGALYEKRLFG